jgi:spore coat protein CotF
MRSLILTATMLAVTAPVAVYAQAAPKFSTASSTINDLIANPEAKAVLQKHMPQIIEYAGQVGGQTLKQLQGMAPDQMTDKVLADLDAELAKIK